MERNDNIELTNRKRMFIFFNLVVSGIMGTYGLATTAAPIIAPTVAGLMIDAFGWKSIWYWSLLWFL